jgi:hypothetical protein
MRETVLACIILLQATAGVARAQLVPIDQFDSQLGGLVSAAFDVAQDVVSTLRSDLSWCARPPASSRPRRAQSWRSPAR